MVRGLYMKSGAKLQKKNDFNGIFFATCSLKTTF